MPSVAPVRARTMYIVAKRVRLPFFFLFCFFSTEANPDPRPCEQGGEWRTKGQKTPKFNAMRNRFRTTFLSRPL